MREETIQIFKFEELSEDAQAKALNNNREWNVEFDWWDGVFQNIADFCRLIGIEVETLPNNNPHAICDNWKIYFSLHRKGQGVSVDSERFDLIAVAQKVHAKAWSEDFTELEPHLTTPPEVRDLLKRECIKEMITSKLEGKTQFSNWTSCDWTVEDCECMGASNECQLLDAKLEEFADWGESLASDLSSLFLGWLDKEYDYLTSNEAVKESLIANEKEFTQDGEDY